MVASKSLPSYTPEDVAKHNKRGDAWVTVDGYVYNVSHFMYSHPGGEDFILEHAGKDVSLVMRDGTQHMHGDIAFQHLLDLRVGVLAGYDGVATTGATGNTGLRKRAQGDATDKQTSSSYKADLFDATGEMHDLIDLEKPVITQLWALEIPRDKYLKFTHTPRYTADGEPAVFFENPILEFLSRNPWYVVLVWLPISVTMALLAKSAHNLDWFSTLGAFAVGIVNWTFLEYSLHRFLFHMDGVMPDNRMFICLHFMLHGVHHFLPMDRLRLVFPPTLAAVIAVPIYLTMTLFYPAWAVQTVFAGTLFGFMLYDLTHYYLHHGVPLGAYFRELKSYHLNHHYKDYHLGYGISSKFWDYVFGTVLYDDSKAKA